MSHTTDEIEIETNSKRVTSLFRIGQTAIGGILVWMVSSVYLEMKASALNQSQIAEQLKGIQQTLITVDKRSMDDHDKIITLNSDFRNHLGARTIP